MGQPIFNHHVADPRGTVPGLRVVDRYDIHPFPAEHVRPVAVAAADIEDGFPRAGDLLDELEALVAGADAAEMVHEYGEDVVGCLHGGGVEVGTAVFEGLAAPGPEREVRVWEGEFAFRDGEGGGEVAFAGEMVCDAFADAGFSRVG